MQINRIVFFFALKKPADNDAYEQEADYCVIDEVDSEPDKPKVSKRDSGVMCLTLKKNEEKIRREIRLATSSQDNETSRITMCDQMLLKFYLKHIEENLGELKTLYDIVNVELGKESGLVNESAHKLALNGHKLLFICDTLQRNLNNKMLKQTLGESSNSLCESLQLYMIRIKSSGIASPTKVCATRAGEQTVASRQNLLIRDALLSVFNSANGFKQNILKYYFKSF